MLENLIRKYKQDDVEEVVYKLSYAGKFVIVKAKTLSGSLFLIDKGFHYFKPEANPDEVYNNSYIHFYHWYWKCIQLGTRSRFTVKIISRAVGFRGKRVKITQYDLLKAEQKQIDKHRYDPAFLGNATEAYIPIWRESSQSYGWLEKTAVMSFKRYLDSKERKDYISKHQIQPK